MLRALVASAILNVLLLVGVGALGAWAWGAGERAELKAEAARLDATLRVTSQVAKDAATQNLATANELASLVERGRTTRIEYRDRLGRLPPLPVDCIPGTARQAALNDLIRSPTGTPPRDQPR